MLDVDLTVALIKATVQIDQPINDAKRMVGTGFLISVPKKDGTTETVLVTAAHVFEKMPAPEVRVGWRVQTAKGWIYTPQNIIIRTKDGPAWYQHPGQDIAVIPVTVPASAKDAVLPETMLADDQAFAAAHVSAGDEMMTLGYPHGLSANVAGFPILRAGRMASYPVMPSAAFPTFLIDLTAVPGNSGGPVFMNGGPGKGNFIAGVLIKQVEDGDQRLELGVVTDAVFVRQTIDLMLKAEAKGEVPVNLRVQPAAPAPMHTPNGATTDNKDMIPLSGTAKAKPSGEEASASGGTVDGQ